jgi:drug/metabolite transporter (DMT)-like permease
MSTYAYVNPVVAVFLGWLFANEELNARIAIASAIIIGAVIIINLSRHSQGSKKAELPVPEEIE